MTNGTRKARLYIFEGIDGSGKTTQVRLASANLTANGIRHTIVEMPGRSRLAFDIREIINNAKADELSSTTEALLHFSLIRNSLEKYVLPALADGRHVLMDRSHLSTAAYQGASDQKIFNAIMTGADHWLSELKPNKIFFFDIEPQEAANRIHMRGDDTDKYDALPISIKERVRSCYLETARFYSNTFNKIDATGNVSNIASEILNLIIDDISKTSTKKG